MFVNTKKKPFSSQELILLGEKKSHIPKRPSTPFYNAPISYRENAMALFGDKKLCFAVNGNDFAGLECGFYQQNLARASRAEMEKIDCFGVKWIFEPTAGGSISEGGHPLFEDVNEWKNVIKMPDVNDWDWEADAKEHPVDTRFAVEMTPVNGFWFERLISFMDFVNAAMALVDEEQTEAIDELFEATSALACDLVDKICEYWPSVDGFMFHDDWGSQKSPFFSDAIARELFLPHMKHVIGHIHDKGRYFGLHSCGHIADRIPVFIEAGIDTWQMQANANPEIDKLYDDLGDKMVFQITVPEFDTGDDQAAIKVAHDYVDRYCQPGKPTMLITRDGFANKVFGEELYSYSRKHFLNQ